LAISPLKRIAAVAMTGTLLSTAAATFDTAEIAAHRRRRPMRVVQMEPGPMPTLMRRRGLHEITCPRRWSQRCADDLQIAPLRLDARVHVEHALGMPMGRVDDHDVDTASRSAATRSSVRAPYYARHAQAAGRSLQVRRNSVAFWKSFT